jgi:hypothetical protein
MSCPYATALGERGKGVHAQRIFGFAVFDTVATIIAALITSYFTNIAIWKSLVIWFVGGEVLHYIFGVDTAFMEKLGVPKCPKKESH